MSNFVKGIANMHIVLFRSFACEYLPLLWENIQDKILNAPDNMVRTMEITKLEVIHSALDPILKRFLPPDIAKNKIDEFIFKVASLTFNSSFLQQRIIGVKIMADIIRKNTVQKKKIK